MANGIEANQVTTCSRAIQCNMSPDEDVKILSRVDYDPRL